MNETYKGNWVKIDLDGFTQSIQAQKDKGYPSIESLSSEQSLAFWAPDGA